jgi:large repetitive protein
MSKITTLRQAVASNSYFPTRMNRSSQLGKRTSLPFAFTMALTLLLSLVRVGDVWGQSFAIVGTGTASNSTTEYPAPVGNYYYGARHQFFVTAAQLTASGIGANSSISSVGFNVTNTNSTPNLTAFQVKVYTTTATNPLTAWVTTGLVAQSTASNITLVTGWNQFNLASSFVWNGTANLVIETCFNNTGYGSNASTQWTTTGLGTGTWSRWYRADAAGVCGNTGVTGTSTTTRPKMRFGFTPPPTCPTLNSPANLATNVSLSPTLSWTAGSNTSTYDVYLSTDQTLVNNQNVSVRVSNNQTGTTYSAAGLTASSVYYWRVVPKNSGGTDATGCTTRSFTTAAPSPTLSVSGTLSFSGQCVNTTSNQSSFAVSGVYLTNNVSIGAVTGYTYSTNAAGPYTSTLTLTPSSGTLSSTTIFVRFTPTSATTFNGPIVVSSTGASSQSVTVTGTGLAPPTVSAGSNVTICAGSSTTLNGSTNATAATGTASATYSLGNGSTEYSASPSTSINSNCPLNLTVSIPVGALITSVNVSYSMSAVDEPSLWDAGYMSEQASFLECTSIGGLKESQISYGSGNSTGIYNYNRTNLSIANSVVGGGNITFRLHAFKLYAWYTGCSTSFNYVNNNSFTVTVNYTIPVPNSWSPSTGLSSTSSLTPTATPTSTTTYTLTSTSSNGCSASDQVLVTVLPLPTQPTVSLAGSYCNSTTITASNGSSGTMYFQGTTSNGTSTATPSSSQSITSSGTYYFRAYNGTCWGTQGSATIVINTQPVITVQPSSSPDTKCQSSETFSALSVTATGTNLTYQWYSNTTASTTGGTLISGATNASYIPSSATVGTLYYYCIVSSASCPSTTSSISGAHIVIASPALPSVSVSSSTINVGGSVSITGIPGNTANTLNWYNVATAGTPIALNNTPVDQTLFNTANIPLTFCTPGTTTTYYLEEVDAINSCPSVRTPFTITTNPISTSSPSNLLICQTGGSVTMTANVVPSSSTPLVWQSSSNGSTFTTLTPQPSTPSILTISPTSTTHYRLAPVTPLGCSNSITIPTFQVGVLNPLDFTPTAAPSSVCVGGTSALTANLSSGSFNVSSIAHSPSSIPPVGSFTTLASGGSANVTLSGGTIDDGGWGGIPIGFTYNFFGTDFTSLGVGTNGLVMFGNIPGYTTATGQLGQFSFLSPTFPNASNPGNVIGLMLSDMDFSNANSVLRYWTEGVAPTRRFIVQGTYAQWSGGALTTVQLKLYETTGIAEVHITSSAATLSRSVGLQSAIPQTGQPTGEMAPGWNGRTTTLTTPEAWRFTPGAIYTYQWATAGSNISGATASTYNTPVLNNAGSFTYNVSAFNPTTQCTTVQPVSITVNALPAAPNSGGNVTACNNATSTTLTATAPTGCVINWYSNSNGTGLLLAGSSNYSLTPPSTAGTYTYYAFSENSSTGCISATGTAVTLTVVAAPAAPVATTSIAPTYCEGSTAVQLGATALAGNTLNWYTGSLSSTASTTAPTPSTATNTGSPFIYYATQVSGSNGCESNPTTFTVTVNNTPAAPVYSATVNGAGFTISPAGTITYCQGASTSPLWVNTGSANLLANPNNNQIYWYYSAPTGAAGQTSTSPVPSSVNAGTTIYYVSRQNTVTGCEGPRTPVTVVINPSVTPLVSVSTTSASTCAGSPYVFTATPTYGGTAPTYAWALGSASVGTNSSTFTYTDAYDQASNYGSSWTNGSNLGSGFSPWVFIIGANTGAFIGNPANDGSGTSGIGTSAFGIYATGSTYLNARRPIVNGMMVGEELSFYWIFNWDAGSGSKGFDLKAGGTLVFNVNNTGSSTITTTNGTANTNYGTTPMLVTLTRTSASQYNFSMTSRSGGATYSTTINSAANIDAVDFYIGGQNDGAGQRNLYFNHLRKTLAAGAQISVSMVSNYANCLFTPNATSTPVVMTGAPVAPSVSITQSTNTTICAGTSVTFSVLSGLNMGSTPTYAWKINGVTVGTSATYTTTGLTNNDVVTLSMTSSLPSSCLSASASANSNAITMTVTPATAITAQPANASVCLGGSQSLSVTAVGTGTITYQWQSSTSPTGTFSNISFASNSSSQSATLSVPSVAGQLSYQLVANSSCGSATSNVATISINQATVINTQPQTQTVCQGSPVTFSVGAIGTGTLTYQWRYNGAPISGATASSYTISSLALGDAGAYSVVVTATCGSVTSANAQLTVTPLTTISVQPVGSTVCAGSPVNLSVTAAGTGTLTYQWMQNGTAVAGATSALYTIPTSLVSQSGSYTVVVTGGCSSLTSSAATVVVNTVTAINTQPLSYTGCAFAATSLTVGAVGTNLTYAWSVGTTPLTGTSATYSLSNPQTSNSGNYTVVVSGLCGTETSNIALVTINPLPSPGIINGGVNGICVASSETLTNNVSGGVWTSNNTSIATVNPTTGAVTGVAAGNVTITYTVTNTFGCSNTTTKVIQIKALPTAVILPPPATQFCIGESMTLQASNAFGYLWSNGATTQSTTVSTSGNYTVTATGNNGCTATSTPLAISVIPAPSVGPIVGSSNLCVGSSYNFTSSTANGLWTSNNPSVVNVNPNSGLVTASAAGTAVLTYNVANVPGCLNTNPGSTTASVTVNTPPVAQITVGGATTFCQGGSVTLTASSGVSYLWSNGATTQAITATSSGSYTVTVTNANGCSTTSLAVPVTVNPAPNANIFPGSSVNVCAGSSVTLSTGTAAAYAWSNGATTPTISVNAAGSFSVTLTGSNGCTATSAATTVTLTSLPTANITTSGATSICQGSSVSLSATSGTGYTYLWSNGATTQTINATASGAYSVTVSNNGCSASSAATSVNVIPTPTASITASGPLTFCDGGSVTLSAPSGNGFTYAWSNGSIAQNISSAVSGTFSVTVSNSFGCSATSTAVAVTVNPLPAISQLSGPSTVCMGSSGTLTHAFTGGIYSVANTSVAAIGQTSGAITPVAPGSTLVTYTYANAFGCSNSVQTNLTVNPSPSATATPNGATTFCQGGSVGIAAPAALQTTYLWSNGSTQQNINASTSGNYNVVMTNSFGCSSTSNTVAVTVNALPSTLVYPSAAVTICSGNSVTLSTSTAAAYQWSNGSSAATITVNAAGSYTATLTGSNGCTATTAPIVVTVNQTPTAAITASGPTAICQGSNVTLTATAGVGYTYLWSNGATTASITASAAGANTVTVTNNGCSATSAPATITINPVPSAAIAASGPLSFCDGGTVTLTAPAGNNFTYLWTNGSTSQSVSTTTSGSFGLTVTNAFGCSTVGSPAVVTVNPLPAQTPLIGSTTVCQGTGPILSHAVPGGIYATSNSSVLNVATLSGNLTPGNIGTAQITYTYSNAFGCSNAVTQTFSVNPSPTASISPLGATTFCQGGSVDIQASTGASTYLWSNGATTSTISAATSGTYTVVVSNTFGCTATSNAIAVNVNPAPNATIYPGASVNICDGSSVTLSTGTAAAYLWSNGSTAPTITLNAAGTYSVVLTGSNGCTATSSATTVTVTPVPVASISASGPTAICQGSSVTLTAAPATNYLWNNGATTQSITVSTVGSYFVNVGTGSCSATSTPVFVSYNPVPVANITPSGPTTFCLGSQVTLNGPAGNGYTYLWSNGATTQGITSAAAGNFSVTVTNAFGCSASSSSQAVVVNPLPVVTPITGTATLCSNGQTQLANVMTGGIYTSSNLNVASIGNASGLVSGIGAGSSTISYLYTDNNGCSNTVTYPITVVAAPVATIAANGATSFCQGGSVGLQASSGAAYLWSTGATTPSINVSTAGNYSVTVTAANGCSSSSTSTPVVVNTLPTAAIQQGATVAFCAGASAQLTAVPAASYLWSNGSTAQTINVLAPGSYTVSVTGTNGCTATSSATVVTQTALPTATISASGSTAICQGASVTLTASTASSYLWSNGATSQSITVLNPGSYTVQTSNGSCIANSAPTTVSLNPVPTANITANGPTTFCSGGQVTLAATTGNNFNYLWSNGSTAATLVSAVAGNYSVTVTNSFGCSATSAPQAVVVNAVPTVPAISGSATVCSYAQTLLSNTLSGGVYSISNPSVATIGQNSGLVSGLNAGTAVVSYTVTNTNGCTATATLPFTVLAAPAASVSANGSTSFCQGASLTLTSSAGASYAWNTGATTPSITTTAGGTYSVTVTAANGCSAQSQNMILTVNALPTVATTTGSATVCSNGTTLLGNTTGGGVWSSSNTALATVNPTSGLVTGVAAGALNINYTVTSSSGCSAVSSKPMTVITPTAATIGTSGTTTICQGSNVTLTASSSSSYLWSTGATTQSITVAQSGPYSVTTVNNGCTAVSATTTVTVVNPPVASISANGLTALCSGGTVTLTAAPATTYLWSTGATTQAITVSAAGNYSVTATANGCSATSAPTAVTLQATPSAAVTAGGATSFCQGGSVTLTAASAGSYLWSNGANTQSITVTAGGSYSVNVSTNGCSATSTPTVVSILPSPTAVITNTGSTTFCSGGSVVLNAPTAPTGSTFTYVWRLNGNPITGATAQTFTANAAGAYSLVVTNNQGCTATSANTTVVVNALPTATITASGSTTICAGASVTLSAPAGAAYVWSNGATTQSIAASTAGAYTVTVNSNGCTATSSATTVTVNALPVATISASGATNLCQGSSVTLTASPATTYLWSTGATTPSITVNTAGNYSVSSTTNGCTASSVPTTINVQALPSASISVIGATTFCQGASVTLTASSAGSYLWSNGATTQTIVATTPGNYTVQVSSNGCSATSSAIPVVVNALPTASINAAGPTSFCQGGTVTLTAAPASAYLWSNGATTSSITVNTSGSYGVQLTNALGCTAQATPVVVNVQSLPTTPQIVVNGSLALCPGATVTLSAPTAASYLWTNGATTQTISVSTAANYGLTVANAAGCSAVAAPVAVTSLSAPTAVITANGPTTFCQGGTVVLSAGPASSYLWSNGATTQSIAVQNAGLYAVQVTANGCSATSAPTTIVVNALPSATITANGPTTFCQGGSVVLSAPLASSYLWSTGATSQQIAVSSGGQYELTLTSNGCSASASPVLVSVQALPSSNITASGSLTFCEGGSVVLSADPATSYAWSNGQTTQSITVAQTANITLTTSNGVCTATSAPVAVTMQAAPALAAIAGAANACIGNNTSLSNATTGGVWSSAATGIASIDNNGVVTGVSQGNTTVQYAVTYANGCTVTTTMPFTVNSIAPVAISANGPLSFCSGGAVQLSLPAGLSYAWSNGSTFANIVANASATYSATVTNAAGCTYQVSPVQVTVYAAPSASVQASSPALCSGQPVTLSAATAAANYSWSTGAQTNAITVNQPGNYVLTLQDANGCSASTIYNLATGITPSASITAAGATSFCAGASVVLNANNYTGGSYLWSNGATGTSITANTSGLYAVTITSPSGCSATSNAIAINVLSAPSASIAVNGNTTSCSNQTLSLAVSGTGSYLWTNGLTAQSISPAVSGNYGVTVTGANGCQTTVAPVAITILPAPIAAITANGPTTFCEGGSVALTASGAATYAWSTNQSVAQITAANAGIYTVTATAANGCVDTESIAVSVNALPANYIVASGPLSFCEGETVTLSAQSGNTVLWSNGAPTPTITVGTSGTYSAQVTSPQGCSVATNALTVQVNQASSSILNETALDAYILNGILYTQSGTYVQNTTNAAGCDSTITLNLTLTVGLDENKVLTYSVQPNPTDAIFTLVASEALYSNYVIQDAQGKVVATGNLTGTSTTINIDQVARGIYFLKVTEAAEAIRIVKN